MSSDVTGRPGDVAVPAIAQPAAAPETAQPVPGTDTGSAAPDPDPGSDTAQWFLPAGRAGLLPDAMTVSWDEPPEDQSAPDPAGAPPWAAEPAGPAGHAPPPWESGPWPGPGEDGRASRGRSHSAPRAGTGPLVGEPGLAAAAGGEAQRRTGLPAGIVLAAGVVPLVLPGLAAGIIGLRRARAAGSSQLASWAAIVLSVAWAVIIVAVASAGQSGPPAACASYPAPVRQAYATASADLALPAGSAARTTAALQRAVASVTAAAAAAGAAGPSAARTQLVTVASDLELAAADVSSRRPVPPLLLKQLAAAGTALAHSCPA
jgi:hypothetical protein